MTRDIAFDPLTGDLAIGTSINFVEDTDLIAQHLRHNLALIRGTLTIDVTAGVPWLDVVLRKPVDQRTVQAAFQEAILRVTGVQAIEEYEQIFSNTMRSLAIRFRVTTPQGSLDGLGLADPERIAEIARTQGISAVAEEFERQGADALAALVRRLGYDLFPTLERDPVYSPLAGVRECHEWPPLLLLLLSPSGAGV